MNETIKGILISLLCATSLSAEFSSKKDSYKKKEKVKKHSVAADVDGSPSAVKTPSTDQQMKNTEGLRKLEEKLRIEKKQKDATRLKAPSQKPRIALDTGVVNRTPLGNVPFKTKADKEREAAATRSDSPKNDGGEVADKPKAKGDDDFDMVDDYEALKAPTKEAPKTKGDDDFDMVDDYEALKAPTKEAPKPKTSLWNPLNWL